ncbi:MAG: thioredoxin family protein [Nitrososphaerota archaeon]|jgi:thioredoxin 1|nr:thioredoxin family protein [Nitrososphaerota archaeon]MDG6928183.1 thioredoxin family protein [Nitrososphaerota archaeon]MDG6930803.1 thioredoxin family protein [Nitrososphaerota archaeon]MDG6932970.1 thioredoxin family protein [Nitrososphaerota archaeon]MDG6936305.1 thioredoxin family protein [Nitrososphaerota archaeon]
MQVEMECLSEDQVREFIENSEKAVIDFWAPWCAPCHVLHRIVQGVIPMFPEVKFGRVDTQKYPGAADQFSVYGLPTLIIFSNGEPVDRIVGVVPREFLLSKLRSLVDG